MVSPTIYPVAWAADAVPWSAYWSSYYSDSLATGYFDWLSEYGVDRPTVGATISVPALDPSSPYVTLDADDGVCVAFDVDCKVGAELSRLMTLGLIPWGSRDSYYPVTVGPTAQQNLCASGFWNSSGGYHHSVTVSGSGSGCGAPSQVKDPLFDEALGSPWAYHGQVALVTEPGRRVAQLCGSGGCSAYLAQPITVPACDSAGVTMWTQTVAASGLGGHLEVRVLAAGAAITAAPLATLLSYSKADGEPTGGGGGWEQRSLSLAAFAGQSIQLVFYAETDAGDATAFDINEVTTGSLLSYGNFAGYVPQLDMNGDPIVVNGVVQCQVYPAQSMQPTLSHELMEAATDPTGPNAAFWDISAAVGWLDVAPGPGAGPQEVADMCEHDWWNNTTVTGGWGVTFGWSNLNGDCQMSCTMPAELLPSGNLDGSTSGWAQSPAGILRTTPAGAAHSGSGYALLGALEAVQTLTTPTMTLPAAGCRSPEVSFWLNITPPTSSTGNLDYLYVNVNDVTDPSSPTSATMATFSGTDVSASGYVQYWIDLGGYEGRTIQFEFDADETAGTKLTTFALDDVAVR